MKLTKFGFFNLFLSRVMIAKFERIPGFNIKIAIFGEIVFPKFDIEDL